MVQVSLKRMLLLFTLIVLSVILVAAPAMAEDEGSGDVPDRNIEISNDEATLTFPCVKDGHTIAIAFTEENLPELFAVEHEVGIISIDATSCDLTNVDTVIVSREAMQYLVDEISDTDKADGLEIIFDNAELYFNEIALENMMDEITRQSVTFKVEAVSEDDLNSAQRKAAAGLTVYDLRVAASSEATSEQGSAVQVKLGYKLLSGADAASVAVCYLDDDGVLTPVTSTYDAAKGLVTFNAPHFSLYAVGVKESAEGETEPEGTGTLPFTDVPSGSWYYDATAYVYQQGIFTGMTNELFAPGESLTRAMFVKVIGQIYEKAGGTITAESANPFSDVTPGIWYSDYVLWAAGNNLVKGYANGSFGPNDKISREQLAVIMARYLDYTDTELTAKNSQTAYADDAAISSWAKDAVYRMQSSGLMQGKGNNLFDPQGQVTRAEAAMLVMRLLSGN